jgi:phosphoglycolate phosphatase
MPSFTQLSGIDHIIWDWNGTLLDDLDLCLDVINGMLQRRDLPGIDRAGYQEIFDFPVRDYYLRLGFDFSREPFQQISTEFITLYEQGRPNCHLVEGALETLEEVSQKGYTQSILSASKSAYLNQAVQDHGLKDYFNPILGLDNHHAAGKLDLARNYFNDNPRDTSRLLLIGDTTHDAAIADDLGLACLLIPRGHHSQDRLAATGAPLLPGIRALIDLL